MRNRKLGSTGISVSELGLGCSRVGESIFIDHKKNSVPILKAAFDLGVNFFDTASTYGYGSSEEAIGEAFKTNRSEVIIATKAGYLPTTLGRFSPYLIPFLRPFRPAIQFLRKPLKRKTKKRGNYTQGHIRKSLEGSLKRLQTDYVDLLQLHSPPLSVLEEGEIFQTLENLKKEGKIRYYGLSVKNVSDAVYCIHNSDVSAVQIPFNLIEQEALKEVLPLAKEKAVGIIARVPFARGLLTEKARVATGLAEDSEEVKKQADEKKESLAYLLEDKQTSWTQMSLEFILSNVEISTVIAGTASLAHLKENIASLDEKKLSRNDIQEIHAISES